MHNDSFETELEDLFDTTYQKGPVHIRDDTTLDSKKEIEKLRLRVEELEKENDSLRQQLNLTTHNVVSLEKARATKTEKSEHIYKYILEQIDKGVRKKDIIGSMFEDTKITDKRYINALKYQKNQEDKVWVHY